MSIRIFLMKAWQASTLPFSRLTSSSPMLCVTALTNCAFWFLLQWTQRQSVSVSGPAVGLVETR